MSDPVVAATLMALPGMRGELLAALVDGHGSAAAALTALRRGHCCASDDPRLGDRVGRWAAWLRSDAPARVAAVIGGRDTSAVETGDPDWPVREPLHDGPRLLLLEGDCIDEAMRAPRVAIVGTRAATPCGRADAAEIATELVRAGVTVVSGLAIGIDGAAHEAAAAAGGRTIGVVATGLDIVYPRRHATLFSRVRGAGGLVSESSFGTQPEPWRFPVRNRIIAALADVIVVVEATATGGARITADHGLAFGRPVLAMPGSRRNPAAAGCNALIADGAHPLLAPDDVLLALGLTAADVEARRAKPVPSGLGTSVLDALRGEPATLDEVCERTGLGVAEVAAAVRDLSAAGLLARERGLLWPL
jgi:DNA processing protein